MSNSLWPHGLQPTRLLCPPLSPGVGSDPCPLSHWCYLTTSSAAVLFCLCLQSFLASGSFPVSQLFMSGGPSIGVSSSASVLPMNIGLISFGIDWFYFFAVQGTHSQESSPTPQFKSSNSSALSLLEGSNLTSTHDFRKNMEVHKQ